MTDRPSDSSGLTSGDPLNPRREEPPRHESGLPGIPREEPQRSEPPASSEPPAAVEPPHSQPSAAPEAPQAPDRAGLWSAPEPPAASTPAQPAPGYYGPQSPPPPGAGGAVPAGRPAFGGQLVLSGWWRRVGAALVDGLLISAVAIAIMAPFGIGFFAVGNDGNDAGVVALAVGFIVAVLVFAVVALLYAPLMMAKTNGKTLGRMATGIRVVRASGEPMTFKVAAIREILLKALVVGIANSVLFGLPGLLDILWPLWDEENRALHDFPVNTRTILD